MAAENVQSEKGSQTAEINSKIDCFSAEKSQQDYKRQQRLQRDHSPYKQIGEIITDPEALKVLVHGSGHPKPG